MGIEERAGMEIHKDKCVESKGRQQTAPSCVQRASTVVSEGLERLFYNFGFAIASKPWTVILCTFFVSALFGLGMIRFEMKDSSEPIWIPEDSDVLKNQLWVEKNFPVNYRSNMYIVTAYNILDPAVIKQMYKIDQRVKALSEPNNTKNPILNFNWTTICIKLSGECWSNSLLELWEFDEAKIEGLKSTDEVTEKIRVTSASPVYHTDFVPSNWLGGITYDEKGKIVAARAAKMFYVIKATSSNEFNTKILAPDLLWEERFVELGLQLDEELSSPIRSLDVSAIRSFRDESDNSFEGDVMLLMAGVGIIIAYVAIVLGKFNEVEHKVYLALVGVFGIGLASLVSYGLASAVGMFYGPIHPILPFLLLGIGVDDMFVIIEAWNNLTAFQKKKALNIKVALAMQHAGVSITVTSITDIVAFAIGATTTLPALRSFCVYAALGILSLFIIQSSFFVAWLTIDQRRQDASRDACCIWIKYVNFEPNRCSRRIFLPWILRKFFSPLLLSLPIKVLMASLLVGLLIISSYGTYLLKTDSDLAWFLPAGSYLARFLNTHKRYFDSGIAANLYLGKMDYFNDGVRIANLTFAIGDSEFVTDSSISSWHAKFLHWLESREAAYVVDGLSAELDANNYPANEESYYRLLNAFSITSGKQFYDSLKWNDTDPRTYRVLEASKISFTVKDSPESVLDVAALQFFKDLSNEYFPDEAFVWAVGFRNWETNRVIQKELFTNIGIAFVAVFIVTLLLVANLRTCMLVCLCVVFSLVNVCGFMHFWGLTIDTLTSILLIISIGLAIDYSAHVGHTFMTINGTKDERARFTVSTIGPAVVNGGFSTFLAFILLATSDSYIFVTFFKVFFLVVIFGMFNGICILPVMLSWMGPPPYLNAKNISLTANMSIKTKTITAPNDIVGPQSNIKTLTQADFSQAIGIGSVVTKSDANLKHTDEQFIGLLGEQSSVDAKIHFDPTDTELRIIYPKPVSEKSVTFDELVKNCEEYLQDEENPDLNT